MKIERGRGQSFRTDGESRQANSNAREERWSKTPERVALREIGETFVLPL